PAAALRERVATAAPTVSLGDLRAAMSADLDAWTWQRGGSAAQPASDTLTAWLATLDEAARGRWRRVGGASGASALAADAVQLLRDGRVVHRLQIDGERVQWDTVAADGSTVRWQATLAPDDASALHSRLDAA